MTKPTHDVPAIKGAARGQWASILAAIGGVAVDLLDSKNRPCPGCGGTDRFRFTNVNGDGSVFCNQCNHDCGDGIAALMWLRGWTFLEALAELAKHLGVASATAGHPSGKPKIVATYDYRDEADKLLFQVIRYLPKSFKQRRPIGSGEWDWHLVDAKTKEPLVRLVPYRLPELLAAPAVWAVAIVEGEKDVDRLAKVGIVATTCAIGAGKWRSEYAEHFRGRKVVILPDNDEVGRKHAQQVAASLHGVAGSVRVVELPGLPEKGDVSDWLDQGGTKIKLVDLVLATSEWAPAVPGDTKPKPAAEPKKPKSPPYVSFPTNTLPAVVAGFVHQGAAALGCDESYIALPTLAVLASAVGNARQIRLKASWCEPCIVWAVLVGESGTLKSPALELSLEPIERLQAAAFARWRDQLDEYTRDKQVFEADLAEWKKTSRKKGEPAPTEPEEPQTDRYLCADATVEALAVLLERSPRGLLMARDELSGWVNSFDAYKSCRGADVAHWLPMHRAGNLTVDRKTGQRITHVPKAAVSITGTVQPKALAAALCGRYQTTNTADTMDRPGKEHFDNGLAARLLFCMPPVRPKRWTDADMPPEAKAPTRRLVESLLSLEMGADENGEPVPVDVPLTIGGKAAWVTFYNAHAAEMATMHGDLAAAWSKLEGYAARFALLDHLVRLVSDEPALSGVDEHSVKTGVALARWFADEAARVYAEIGGDKEPPEAREQRELIRIIRDHGGKITARQLMQASRRYRASTEEAEAALGRLVAANLAMVWVDNHNKGGGRPTVVYTLLDSGNGNTTSESPEEMEVLLPLPVDSETQTQLPPETLLSNTPPG